MTDMGLGVLRGQRHIPSKIKLSTPPLPTGSLLYSQFISMVHAQRKEKIMKYMMVINSLFTSIYIRTEVLLTNFSPVTSFSPVT